MSELGQKRSKFDSFLILAVYKNENVTDVIFLYPVFRGYEFAFDATSIFAKALTLQLKSKVCSL